MIALATLTTTLKGALAVALRASSPPPTLPAAVSMRRQPGQHLLALCLLLGCNSPKTGESDADVKTKCSTHTACSFGYKRNYGSANPSDPHAIGECNYQLCGLTQPCKKPQACLPDRETASCDKFDNDKFCGCVGPNSQEVPSDPMTGSTPTGGKP